MILLSQEGAVIEKLFSLVVVSECAYYPQVVTTVMVLVLEVI